MSKPEFSDEDLTAFLDGEADRNLSARIESALAVDQGVSARLEELSVPMDALNAAGAILAASAPEMQALPPRAPERRAKNWGVAGMAAASLVIGIGIGALALRPAPAEEPAAWIAAIAAYQVLYVPETIANADQSLAQTAAVLQRFSEAGSSAAADLREIEGLTFARAQILGLGSRPLLQVAYADSDGQPVAICAVRVTEADRDFETDVIDGLAATHWVEGGIGYLVIGGTAMDQTAIWAADASAKWSL